MRRTKSPALCYLRSWAGDDGNCVASAGELMSEPKCPEKQVSVCDVLASAVSKEAERETAIYESEGIDALRRIDADWLLDLPIKAKIGALVAVHMVCYPVLLEIILAFKQADHRKAAEYEPELSEQGLRTQPRPDEKLNSVFRTCGDIPKTASRLVDTPDPAYFGGPRLATGDKPATWSHSSPTMAVQRSNERPRWDTR